MRKQENVMKLNITSFNITITYGVRTYAIFFFGGGGGWEGYVWWYKNCEHEQLLDKSEIFPPNLRFPAFHSDCCSVYTVPKSALIIMISFLD